MRRGSFHIKPSSGWPTGVPVTLGAPTSSSGAFGAVGLAINDTATASAKSTVATFSLNISALPGGTTTCYAVSGTLSGTTFTVRDRAAITLAAATGVTNYTVALKVDVGDRLAFWQSSTGTLATLAASSSSGPSHYLATTPAVPTAGQVYTSLAAAGTVRVAMQGTTP